MIETRSAPTEDGARSHQHARAATSLWATVVLTAVNDAFRMGGPDQREALSFLLSSTGGWRESRETVCDAIGQDPDALRRFAIDVCEGRRKEVGFGVEGATRPKPKALATAQKYWSQLKVSEALVEKIESKPKLKPEPTPIHLVRPKRRIDPVASTMPSNPRSEAMKAIWERRKAAQSQHTPFEGFDLT